MQHDRLSRDDLDALRAGVIPASRSGLRRRDHDVLARMLSAGAFKEETAITAAWQLPIITTPTYPAGTFDRKAA